VRSADPNRVVIVGAGPVACLMAIEWRRRGFAVTMYEQTADPRSGRRRAHSFNLTLTRRGLSVLGSRLRDDLHEAGVRLPQRTVHPRGADVEVQPYGTERDHFLLSVPRDRVHLVLLDEAERRGARLRFGHECVSVRAGEGVVTVLGPGRSVLTDQAGLVVACDGASSLARQSLSRSGARLVTSQEFIPHGYVEATIAAAAGGVHELLEGTEPQDGHSLHVWPRGDHFLLAQPNVDGSHTVSLFMPLTADGPDGVGLDDLTTPAAMGSYLGREYPDLGRHLPNLVEGFLAAPPASLRIVRCAPFHHGRVVLMGDAAHTTVPFYGQGINCSFEDVRSFFTRYDSLVAAVSCGPADRPPGAGLENVREQLLAEYSRERCPEADHVAELSLRNLLELGGRDGGLDRRQVVEKRLAAEAPEHFRTLYSMVAFGPMPYSEAVARHERQTALLDELCQGRDLATESDLIVAEYRLRSAEATVLPRPRSRRLVEPRADRGTDLLTGPDEGEWASVGRRVDQYHEGLRSGRTPASYIHDSLDVMRYSDGLAAADRLRQPDPPRDGVPLETALDTIFDQILTNGTQHGHPGFLAHVPSAGLPLGGLGAYLAHAVNRFPGVWAASPGISQVESNVIQWYCRMLGYPRGAFGYLTTGGSLATFMGLRCALSALGSEPGRTTVQVSAEGHYSVAKAAHLAGIPRSNVRLLPPAPDGSLRAESVRASLDQDRRAGLTSAIVVATAGTTSSGAVDDLPGLAALSAERGAWLHADACFGGFFRITRRGRDLLAGVEDADSIAVDAHKSLFLPHGSSALLVRRKESLMDAFDLAQGAYLPGFTTSDDLVDFCRLGPELTRESRGLTAWLPLMVHGLDRFEAALDRMLDLADAFARRLAEDGRFVVAPRRSNHLPVVAFRLRGDHGGHRSAGLCEAVSARGRVYLTTTEIDGLGTVARACFLQPQTDDRVLADLIQDVCWAADNSLLPSGV
jgi:glutamate/tyrosine decarboxylase-like PLP-dependent enzyme/2-polyprenyl-6-methoxyphenol hydroxylase-like FAD-dependent oxidoreductase